MKVESFDAGSVRTGGLATLIFPAAGDFYQRYATDLDTMTAEGAGSFAPGDPKVQITFELDSTANGTGWPTGAAHGLKIDNISYAAPRFYVSPSVRRLVRTAIRRAGERACGAGDVADLAVSDAESIVSGGDARPESYRGFRQRALPRLQGWPGRQPCRLRGHHGAGCDGEYRRWHHARHGGE